MAILDDILTDDKVKLAEKQYKEAKDYWNDIHQKQSDDLYFLSDNEDAQWNSSDLATRRESGRPALTIDQLGQFIHQVVNDIRMNTPTIDIIPKGDGDIKIAEVYKGLIRHIQQESNADSVYDNAVEFSIKSSMGYIRVDHDFEDNESFDQKLIIKPCINPQGIFFDPNSIELDGSDMDWALVLEDITKDKFHEQYPDFQPVSFGEEKGYRNGNVDMVTVAEYFYKDKEEYELGLLQDGTTEKVREDGEYVAKRKTTKSIITRCKLSGQEILEETTFPGEYIPVVPVYGEMVWANGERNVLSLIRKSKDAQRLYNYWRSLETELLMKQPNSPWLAAEGQVEDFQQDWTNPEKSTVLRYKTTDSQGNPAPSPQRVAPPTIPTGIVNASRETVDDIKATMGMYGASIGQRSNETSGVAIERRKLEGDVATFHFGDNLVKSITQVGRIIVSAIPFIYDTPRILTIIGEEEDTSTVGVNGAVIEDQEDIIDLSQGKYSVKVTTGAPFTTQRQESATAMREIVNASPQLMEVMGDLLFKYSDFPGAQAIEKRIKKTMPPEITQEEGDEASQEQMVIQQLQQQMQQMQQALESKDQEEQRKNEVEIAKIENDRARLDIESSKVAIEEQKSKAEIILKNRELDIKAYEAEANAEAKDVANEIDMANTAMNGIADLQQSQDNDVPVY